MVAAMAEAASVTPGADDSLTRLLRDAATACRAVPARTHLAGQQVRIRVYAAPAWPAQVLVDEFAPYLAAWPVPDAAGHAASALEDVLVTVDPRLARRLRGLASAPGGRPASFHAKGGWHTVEKLAAVAGSRSAACLAWHDDDPAVSHLVLQDDGPASRRLLLRVVRAIAARTLIAAGWAPLHAACAVTAAGAVCLLGEHGGGKTTALLHLLAAGKGRTGFLANSTVFLSRGEHGVQVCGLPFAAGIRPATLRMFPVLADLATRDPVWEADASPVAETPDSQHRLLVTPRQLAGAFAVPLTPAARLAAVAGISYQPEPEARDWQSRWKRLASPAALELCRSAYRTQWLPDDPHELTRLGIGITTLRRGHHQMLEAVTRTVPTAVIRPVSGARAGTALYRALDELLA